MTSEVDTATLLEEEILKEDQFDVPLDHQFCTGVYARSIYLPRGTLLTGLVHRDESFFVVRSGLLVVTTDEGDITAAPGFMSITKPGTKRAGYALTNVIVTTFHANPEELRENNDLVRYLAVDPPDYALAFDRKEMIE